MPSAAQRRKDALPAPPWATILTGPKMNPERLGTVLDAQGAAIIGKLREGKADTVEALLADGENATEETPPTDRPTDTDEKRRADWERWMEGEEARLDEAHAAEGSDALADAAWRSRPAPRTITEPAPRFTVSPEDAEAAILRRFAGNNLFSGGEIARFGRIVYEAVRDTPGMCLPGAGGWLHIMTTSGTYERISAKLSEIFSRWLSVSRAGKTDAETENPLVNERIKTAKALVELAFYDYLVFGPSREAPDDGAEALERT